MDEQASSSSEGVRVPGFQVVRRIGVGGFATVYEAMQEDVQAPVALKVLALDHAEDRVRARFERECRTMGTLRGQRGVVPVYQATYSADGRPVIVMALMTGGTLLDRLERRGPLPAYEVIEIGVTTAMALQAAHERGVHHRDVKPENILLDEEGNPGLSDFGIASIGDLSSSTRTAASLSPPHAPPERFQGRDGEDLPAGDIYSLASTLYQLLAGVPPFGTSDGGGLASLVDRVMNSPVPPIEDRDVPPPVMAVLVGAMAKDPKDRPASAREFAEALSRCRSAGTAGESTPQPTPRDRHVATDRIPAPDTDEVKSPTDPMNPNSTRIIRPDLLPVTSAGDVSASSGGSRRRRYYLLAAVGVAVLAVAAALVISRGTSSPPTPGREANAVQYSKLEVEVTPATAMSPIAFTLLWNGVPLGNANSTAVVYCTAPWGSESCEGKRVSLLADQEPGTWPDSPRFRHRSPLLISNNEGLWQPNWLYCFAIINEAKTLDRGARLSDWSCAKG